MKDRSPLSHVDLLRAPILLTHGSNDWRVPVGESRAFNDKAKALGRPVTYVEFEGQGHGIEGLVNQRKLYQTRFDFLMRTVQDSTAAATTAPPYAAPATTPTATTTAAPTPVSPPAAAPTPAASTTR
jgi:acetyl esterase/lipase